MSTQKYVLSESRIYAENAEVRGFLGASRFHIFGSLLLISFLVGVGLVPTLRPYGTHSIHMSSLRD